MFGTKHNECVGFESKWKVTKVSCESTSQTTEFSVAHKGSSTTVTNSVEIQTDALMKTAATAVDMEKLAKWLNGIYPAVKKEIDEANNSKAFKGYRLLNDLKNVNCKLLQTINIAKVESGDASNFVSALSWNTTGKTLAVSRNYSHTTWCHHEGVVFIYMLNRDGVFLETPKKIITTESCVTTVMFHCFQPALLAVGTFSGNILIWNVYNEEGGGLLVNINAHDESITHLSWIPDIDSTKNYLLGSSSIDGFLKLWNFNQFQSELNLKVKYKIKAPIFGNTNRKTDVPDEFQRKVWRGVLCFDFSKHVPDMFVVALEGGLIAQCSMIGATELKGSTPEEPMYDPIFKFYEPNEGELTSVSFSPNRKEMFMTLGMDGDIRIYIIGQDDPAQVIFANSILNCITWVPYEEKLIAGCGTNGVLEVFHLQKAKPIENIIKEKVAKSVLLKMAINPDNIMNVVVGSVNGDVQLWSVPWNLISYNNE